MFAVVSEQCGEEVLVTRVQGCSKEDHVFLSTDIHQTVHTRIEELLCVGWGEGGGSVIHLCVIACFAVCICVHV